MTSTDSTTALQTSRKTLSRPCPDFAFPSACSGGGEKANEDFGNGYHGGDCNRLGGRNWKSSFLGICGLPRSPDPSNGYLSNINCSTATAGAAEFWLVSEKDVDRYVTEKSAVWQFSVGHNSVPAFETLITNR